MTFENLENIVSLLCTIIGLLYCVFKYIDKPRRGYTYIIVFFLANFLSEYYWTIYELVTGSFPNVSWVVAYTGWNIGYLFILLAVFFMRSDGAKRFFHPIMILPVLVNVPQFILYLQFGGILNNLYEVGVTTLTSVICFQELAYQYKKKETVKSFPWFFVLVLCFMTLEYGMWTSSCFDWGSELLNPYFYCSIIVSFVKILIVYGAGKYYGEEEPESKSTSELRFQVLIQTIVGLVIIGICGAGFFTAYAIRNEGHIIAYLFAISVVLILLILVLLFLMTSRYRRIMSKSRKMAEGRRSRLNLFFTIGITLVLMLFAVIYNSVVLYKASVISVYEDGDEEIETTATELENYLSVAVTTLRVAADSVDLMEKKGRPIEDIDQYIVDQTTRQNQQFDENFTGIYAYVNGHYIDGLNWVPPEGYEPTEREWYTTAVQANGEVVIVSPYLDVQTGSIVITIAKMISPSAAENDNLQNVVCLDVLVNHIKEVTESVEIAGKGYGLVINSDGFIVAHHDEQYNGRNLADIYGKELLNSIKKAENGRLTAKLDDEECTLFIAPVMDQWYAVVVVSNAELFDNTYSQLAVNIMVSLVTFCLIAFFYYLGYRNEQLTGKKVEEMNIQVVSALAAAIDAKDNYTNGHSARVAKYARMIAARTGYTKDQQDEIYMMGLLHDVGKIGVPDNVINKPTNLTDEEYEMVKKHSVIGNSILGSIKERPNLAKGARWHHERYDGKGYPDGIAGELIPEEARLIAVADAYDAMTSRRSYRDILPQEKVLEELRNGSGTQFDPVYAEAMMEIIREDPGYLLRER